MMSAVRRDELGQSSLFDLGPLIGIGSDATIQYFQVEQGWDLSIFLCVATKASATTSNLIVVKPFAPGRLKPGETLSVVPSKETVGTVQQIYMVSGVPIANFTQLSQAIQYDNTASRNQHQPQR
jgi:hypothetical protein